MLHSPIDILDLKTEQRKKVHFQEAVYRKSDWFVKVISQNPITSYIEINSHMTTIT